MRVVGVTKFGGPESLRLIDVPEPQAGPGEIRIRVHAAAVNPTDTNFRAGAMRDRLAEHPGPYVPGMDAAGVIDQIGPDTATELALGDRVVALVVPYGPRGGAYAEQIVVPAASVVRAPADVDPFAASTLLMNAMTARLALDALALAPGQSVAVTGAAGAFGGYVVELAKADGLTVIADASAADQALVLSLGADEVVARGDDIAARIRAAAGGQVPGVADGALNEGRVLDAITDGGGIAVVRGWAGPAERGITIHNIWVRFAAQDTPALDRLRAQAEAGVVTLRVADVVPAAQAAQAHRRLEAGGVRGRLVLDFTAG
jgi:NADPH:quinone reductase-like Zn-dependent oxidoreductase